MGAGPCTPGSTQAAALRLFLAKASGAPACAATGLPRDCSPPASPPRAGAWGAAGWPAGSMTPLLLLLLLVAPSPDAVCGAAPSHAVSCPGMLSAAGGRGGCVPCALGMGAGSGQPGWSLPRGKLPAEHGSASSSSAPGTPRGEQLALPAPGPLPGLAASSPSALALRGAGTPSPCSMSLRHCSSAVAREAGNRLHSSAAWKNSAQSLSFSWMLYSKSSMPAAVKQGEGAGESGA